MSIIMTILIWGVFSIAIDWLFDLSPTGLSWLAGLCIMLIIFLLPKATSCYRTIHCDDIVVDLLAAAINKCKTRGTYHFYLDGYFLSYFDGPEKCILFNYSQYEKEQHNGTATLAYELNERIGYSLLINEEIEEKWDDKEMEYYYISRGFFLDWDPTQSNKKSADVIQKSKYMLALNLGLIAFLSIAFCGIVLFA